MAKVTAKKQPKALDTPNLEPQTPEKPESKPTDGEKEPQAASQVESQAVLTAAPTPEAPPKPEKREKPPRSGIIDRLNCLESWEGYRAYLYRHQPMQNKQGNHSVKTYVRPFDEDDIMKDRGLGSGVYEIVLNYTNPQTRVRTMKDSGMATIFNMEYPPRIPKGEWMDDPKNLDWAWAKDVIDREDAAKNAPVSEQREDSNPLAPVLDKMMQRMEKLEDLILQQRNPQQDPILAILLKKVLEPEPVVTAMLTKLTQPAPPDPGQTMFMQYLIRQVETKTEAVMPKDSISELERTINLSQKMEEHFGGRGNGNGRSSKMSAWMEFLQPALGPFAQMMTPYVQMMAMNMAKTQQQNGQQGPPPQQYYTPPPPPAVQSPEPEFQEVQQHKPQIVRRKPTLQVIANQVLYHLQANKDGFELGDWYLDAFGMQEFSELRTQGKAKIIADLQTTETWKQISAFPRSDELITEFVTWEPAPADEQEEDDEEGDDDPFTARQAVMTKNDNPWTSPKETSPKEPR